MIAMLAHDAIWIGATLAIFFLCRALYLRFSHSGLHPVLWSTTTLVVLILALRHPLASFKAETQPLVWLLGPAVVAMALPIWQKRLLITENWRTFATVIGVSIILSIGTAFLLPPLLDSDMARALSVKSVTAPVALGIAGQTGLRQDLVVVGVMTSGLFGMVIGPALLAFGGLKGDLPEVGAALGCASHGLGTARAYELGQTAGSFASVSMGSPRLPTAYCCRSC